MAVFAHDHIGTLINLQGVYEGPELGALSVHLDRVAPHWKSGRAIDAGANIGNHSRHFAQFFETVEAFEPHPRTFALLSVNAPSNVSCHQCALGGEPGQAVLHDLPTNIGGSSLVHESDAPSHRVEVRTIDEFAFKDVGFVKIDVEGFEEHVLRGAHETIERCHPIIVFEQLRSEFDGNETAAIRLLRKSGYSLSWLERGGKLARLWAKPVFVTGDTVPERDHSMIVALPPLRRD